MKWAILAGLACTCAILAFAQQRDPLPMPANMPTVLETRAILLDCQRYEARQCMMIAIPVPDFSEIDRSSG
jgi:hypothetical protein